MALNESELKKIEKLVGRYVKSIRPASHMRKKLDFYFRVSGQSFEIVERRPQWNDPIKIRESPIAKATYVKSRKVWRLYWMRADLQWHSYEPYPESGSLEKILETIKQDRYHCFWG